MCGHRLIAKSWSRKKLLYEPFSSEIWQSRGDMAVSSGWEELAVSHQRSALAFAGGASAF